MTIELFVEPGVKKSWGDFKKENPPFSMALDGYVDDPPVFSSEGPHINFDHHRGVDRLSTRSTTGQVFLRIKAGLFDAFQIGGVPEAKIFVEDADQDVCPAYWLLKNHERITGTKDGPLIIKLVQVTDLVDSMGGMYPLDMKSEIARERAWLFEPYSNARLSGRLEKMDKHEMRNVIDYVCGRIDKYVVGRGKQIPTNTNYEIIGGGESWKMVIEKGIDARPQMAADGIKAFVSVRDLGDGKFGYSIGRSDVVVPYPIQRFFSRLNECEGLAETDRYHWGGSNIIGGSPKIIGSKMSPKEVELEINDELIST